MATSEANAEIVAESAVTTEEAVVTVATAVIAEAVTEPTGTREVAEAVDLRQAAPKTVAQFKSNSPLPRKERRRALTDKGKCE